MTRDGRDALPMMTKTMRFKSAYVPMTPAERKRKSRAIKAGTYYNCQVVTYDPPQLTALSEGPPADALPPPTAKQMRALPAPPVTAIQKASPASAAGMLALSARVDGASGDAIRLSLPPAVAARLKSLLDRHQAGHKPLTAAERAEAEGLIDVAEFFVVQRMRIQLAA